MNRITTLFLFLASTLYSVAQIPSSLYDNLGIYLSVAVYENGEQVEFEGTDYLYIDYADNGDVNALFYDNKWESKSANLIRQTSEYLMYEVENSAYEDLTLMISPDRSFILVEKDGDDISIAYQLTNGGSYNNSSYGNAYSSGNTYSGGYSGGYDSSSSSNGGRSCAGCNGTGKCTMCAGKGWYYHETGYYTGTSGKKKTDCPACHGSGKCGTCYGNGIIR